MTLRTCSRLRALLRFTVVNIRPLYFTSNLGDEQPKDKNDNTEENPDREVWASKTDYLLSMVGYAVGLGNVWRFPYLAFQHGGGAFLIPYIIMLALAGLPLFFLECSLGQFASLGPVSIWRIAPIFQGVGITMVLISALVSIYYNVIVAYSLYYLFASFQRILPWSDCFAWADEKCRSSLAGIGIEKSLKLPNQRYQNWNWNTTEDIRKLRQNHHFEGRHPAKPRDLAIPFGVQFQCDLLQQALIVFSNSYQFRVWKDAATQIFYSLSTAWGGLIALSSYNKFHNNCYFDSIVVCIINFLTSVIAGFAIFSILGHMALVSGKPVSEVIDEGFALAFIAYPDALTKLPVSPLWSFLFFCMLLTLGLDSQFAMIETITTSVQDAFPQAMKKMRIPITTAICIVLFLLGITCVTQAGIYWVILTDSFCGGWALLFVAVLELIAVIWIYGGERIIADIEMMLGKKHWIFWLWWRACWYFVSPTILTAILIWSLVTFTPPKYAGKEFPTMGMILGWLMIIFCIIWIPVIAILKIIQAKGNLWQRIVICCRPTKKWGPALVQNRGERYQHMDDPKNNEDLELPKIQGLENSSFQQD
ncbi:sodium- and chloride-dependent neutral and basic amino acid transporter B(0+)-like [Bombina bombina]|uniref:sodium- and chloride-dependent neutral and basic amino acid transporter B(0+)-like n=1 Tax=Bombina bombina TaxID=8345 RepID=UPI00235A4F7C|nr:sodium- and chloride-dependent neutral and basic amino acid transporter B(0+)-like [Bombina bombina]